MRMAKRWAKAAVLVVVAGLTGCGGDMMSDIGGGAPIGGAPGEFGATQGGVQDMQLAREYVRNGTVPPPEAFVVEGMFSEHDLPLTGPACHTLLCLRTAVGLAPTHDGVESAWLQVGMSSTVDPGTFQRAPQSLVLTVDVSGSMGWNYGTDETAYPTPGRLARELLLALVGRLGPDDRVALVTYGDSIDTVLPFVPGDDPRLPQAIEALRSDGYTYMEGGLKRAYELAAEAGSERPARVMLFTDERPNVGATEATEFQRIVQGGADQGVGLTIFGLGLGLGAELFDAMSVLRGGNAFSLYRLEDVPALLEDSWPWMVSPIAYDLAVELAASEGYRIAEAYGFPGHEEGSAGFDVASVFLSRRKGGMLLRLEPASEGGELAGLRVDGSLSYEDLGGELVTQALQARVDGSEVKDPQGRFFEQPGVGKSVALALLVSGMREAAERYAQDPADATAHLLAVRDRFVADAEALGDGALDAEAELATALLVLMEQGAPQADLYGHTR